MKKILATLLVATMLLSCLTFIGFAAGSEVYLPESLTFSKAFTTGLGKKLADPATLGYYNTVFALYEAGDTSVENSPVFMAIYELVDSKGATSSAFDALNGDFSLTKNEYVGVPIYADATTGINTIGVQLKYDSKLLTPITTKANTFEVLNINSAGYFYTSWSTTNNVTGYLGSVFFKVNADAVGNASGDATTDIEIIVSNDPAVSWANAADGSAATYGNKKMSVSLTGLEKGEEEEKDPVDITGDDFATSAGVVSSVVPAGASCVAASGLSAADKAMFVAGNADSDITNAADDAVYSAVFATIDLTGKNAPDAYGFVIIPEDGTGARFYEAKANTVDGGKFGMVFFGDAATLGLYKAAPAVKVDGEWLYNAENASAL